MLSRAMDEEEEGQEPDESPLSRRQFFRSWGDGLRRGLVELLDAVQGDEPASQTQSYKPYDPLNPPDDQFQQLKDILGLGKDEPTTPD
jgi:hypothetical protein